MDRCFAMPSGTTKDDIIDQHTPVDLTPGPLATIVQAISYAVRQRAKGQDTLLGAFMTGLAGFAD
jgi:hypothetical protein